MLGASSILVPPGGNARRSASSIGKRIGIMANKKIGFVTGEPG